MGTTIATLSGGWRKPREKDFEGSSPGKKVPTSSQGKELQELFELAI